MANILQKQIQPEQPKVLGEERIYVYVPEATYDDAGIASYNSDDFSVNNGRVKVKWPYAHNKPTNTNGYGLMKIADNSEGGLKYDENNLLTVDVNSDIIQDVIDKKIADEAKLREDADNLLSNRIIDLDNRAVHKTGDEYIEGTKNFEHILIQGKEIAPDELFKIGIDTSGSKFTITSSAEEVMNAINNNKLVYTDINYSDGSQNSVKFRLILTNIHLNTRDPEYNNYTLYFSGVYADASGIENIQALNMTNAEMFLTMHRETGEYSWYSDEVSLDLDEAENNALKVRRENLNSWLNDSNRYPSVYALNQYLIGAYYNKTDIDTKLSDISSIRIRNVDGQAIEATEDTVQTVATNYIKEKLGRDPLNYDGLFITRTDENNDIIEYGYFNGTWINVGLNGVDLSNYVTIDTIQTITGDKDFTGKLTLNGNDVATSKEAQKLIILGADGVGETEVYSFTVKDAESYLPYRSTGTKFLVDLHLEVVGDLDMTKPVAITFGDTTYYVYSILKDTKVTLGDLHQVDKYSNAVGYRFITEMIFFETTDLTGFYIIPTVSMSDVLSLNSDELDSYMADGGLTQGQLAVCNKVITNGYTVGALYRFDITYPSTYEWTEINTPLEVDNKSIVNTKNVIKAQGLIRSNDALLKADNIYTAISIQKGSKESGTYTNTVLSKGSIELSMIDYEGLSEVDNTVNYNILDYPDFGITNAQMKYALTCVRLFPANSVFICLDTDTYTAGHIYKITVDHNVKSWTDITPTDRITYLTDITGGN